MISLYKYVPNTLTVLRILSAPFLWYAITTEAKWFALFLISFAIASDFGDGYFARKFFLFSRAGSFLDPLADKIVIIAALTALWQHHVIPWWVVCVVVWRDIAVTLLRIFMVNRGMVLKTSWFAKTKTAFQFFALYLFVLGMEHQSVFFYWLSVATAVLTVASSASYWVSFWRSLVHKKAVK